MKKKLLILVCVVALTCFSAAALVACGGGGGSSSGSDSSSQGSDSSERTTFTVGFDQDFPPYGYIGDDGEYTGFDLDLAAEVADRNGWELVLKPINWDAKDAELESGSIDCIWNGFTIEGREDGYTFTDPYMDNSQVIVVKADSGIASLDDLEGKVVAAQIDSAALHLLEAGGDQEDLAKTFNKVQTVPEYNSAFMDLEAGAVDAVAMDLPVAKFQIAGKESQFIILEDDPLSSEHYGVGFLKGETDLRDTVQKTLLDMVEDGTVKDIAAKYEDQGISYDLWILGNTDTK